MNSQDIRWKQRLNNFNKAMLQLENALKIEQPDILQKAGIIQFFEMSFELAWNTIKDYLEAEGYTDIRSPRSAIKKAFEVGLIKEGHQWMQLLQDRNLTTHTYDEKKVTALETVIKEKYFALLNELMNFFNDKASQS